MSYAQAPTNIDSLKKIYRKHPNQLENISLIAQSYLPVNTDSASFYAKVLLKKSTPDNYDILSRAYTVFGHIHFMNNRLDSSVYYHQKAIELNKKGNLKFIEGVNKTNLAQVLMEKGEIKLGIIQYLEAEKLIIENDDKHQSEFYLSTLYSGIGEAYNHLGLYDEALKNLFKSYKISDKLNDITNKAITLFAIANTYKDLKNWEKSKEYNISALKLINQIDYPLANGMVYQSLAELEFINKNNQATQKLIDSSLYYFKKSNNDFSIGNVYNLLGQLNLKEKKWDEAYKNFSKGLEFNIKSNMLTNVGKSYLGLSEYYVNTNNQTTAYEYLRKALNVFTKENLVKEKEETLQKILELQYITNNKDSLQHYLELYKNANFEYLNSEKQKAIAGQEVLFETDLKESKIKTQELIIQKEKDKQRNIILGISFFLLISGLGAYGFVNHVKKNRLKDENMILDLQKNMTFMELQNINQQLNPHEFKNMLIQIAPEIQEKAPLAYRSLLKLLNLTKQSIGNNTFIESIENQIYQIESYLTLTKDIISVPLEWEIKNKLDHNNYFIPRLLLKNLVENSVKHGIKNKPEGGNITVELTLKDNFIHIVVDDSGLGRNFNSQSEKGIGIETYQKLFNTLNSKNKDAANLTFVDKPIGTLVNVIIPIDYKYT